MTLFSVGVNNGYIDPESRAVKEILFLDGVENDGSFQARAALFRESLPLLADQFWIGNYALVAEVQGGFAGYSHNLLSAWQFYGFYVFVAIILSLIYSLRRAVKQVKISARPVNIFGVFMLVYVTISVIISKYVGWNLLWFTLGFWFCKMPMDLKRNRKKNRKRKRRKRSIPV